MVRKTKSWIRDKININDYQIGQLVVVARRKSNGYPRHLIDDEPYQIKEIENENLILYNLKFRTPNVLKVHFSYCLNLQLMRDEIINDLLKD
jgi:hypothetical protein